MRQVKCGILRGFVLKIAQYLMINSIIQYISTHVKILMCKKVICLRFVAHIGAKCNRKRTIRCSFNGLYNCFYVIHKLLTLNMLSRKCGSHSFNISTLHSKSLNYARVMDAHSTFFRIVKGRIAFMVKMG